MNTGLNETQHKRIVALAGASIIFALFALWQLGQKIFVDGEFAGFHEARQSIYLYSCCTLMLCAVVVITIRSFQDNAKLLYIASHDSLTSLLNKQRFLELIGKSRDQGGLIMLIDLVRLKTINSTFGRDGGDELLAVFSQRLIYFFDQHAVLARINAGTFGIFIPGLKNEPSARHLSGLLLQSNKHPLIIDGMDIFPSLRMGGFIMAGGKCGPDLAYGSAELALAEAKVFQSEGMVLYNHHMAEDVEARSRLETEFQQVLESSALETYFQPLVDGDGKTLRGVEALARWHHPDKGFISPASFVPLAEELGFAGKLGAQIMRKACQAILPLGNLKLAVNVSAKHFMQQSFVAEVTGILRETGFPAERLEIELTESVFAGKDETVREAINALRLMGISIALDDFGTGYSGLAYLNKLKVDRIKIDAEFVRNIATSADARSMIATIINLASERKCAVTVEGVETEDQFAILREYPDLCYQGYLFGRPMPVRELVNHKLMDRINMEKFLTDIDTRAARHPSTLQQSA